MNHFNH